MWNLHIDLWDQKVNVASSHVFSLEATCKVFLESTLAGKLSKNCQQGLICPLTVPHKTSSLQQPLASVIGTTLIWYVLV